MCRGPAQGMKEKIRRQKIERDSDRMTNVEEVFGRTLIFHQTSKTILALHINTATRDVSGSPDGIVFYIV